MKMKKMMRLEEPEDERERNDVGKNVNEKMKASMKKI